MSGRVKYLFISLRNWRGSDLKHSSRLNLACCLEYLHHVIYSFRERTQKARSFPLSVSLPGVETQPVSRPCAVKVGWALKSSFQLSPLLLPCPTLPHPHFTGPALRRAGICSKSFTNQVVASVSTPHLSLPLSYLKYYSIFFPVESAHLFRKGIF